MAASDGPIRSICHCGAITITVPRLPEYINLCQCTLCRRHGAGWAYYRLNEVNIETKPDTVTKQYIWGNRMLSTNFCGSCGCVCYWRPLGSDRASKGEWWMGINTNNMDPEVLRYIDRKVTYASLKSPLRSKDVAHPDEAATYRVEPGSEELLYVM